MAVAFLITPFSAKRAGREDPKLYAAVQRSIARAAGTAGVTLRHPKQESRAGFIWEQIQREIETADLVMAVVTGHNPNALIELGSALAVSKRPPVLICRATRDIAKNIFDIAHMRHLSYGGPGELKTFPKRLAEMLASTLREPEFGHAHAAARKDRSRGKPRKVIRDAPLLDELFLDTGFKDRSELLHDASGWLNDTGTRLICIWGRPGMGRTAVVQKALRHIETTAAGRESEAALDGIVYLQAKEPGGGPRTPESLFEQLFLACAEVLGGQRERRLRAVWGAGGDNAEKIRKLVGTLAEGFYIVAIDDVDVLLDDAGRLKPEYGALKTFLDAALRTLSGTHLLLTSQKPLFVDGEVSPYVQQVKLEKGLPYEDAAALLRDMDRDGRLNLRDARREQLEKIVDVTHGVPLALRLVYSILAENSTLSLDELGARFYSQERVVRELARERLSRLAPDERIVTAGLAIFGRAVSREGIQNLLSPWLPPAAACAALERLIGAAAVSWDRRAQTASLDPVDQELACSAIPERDGDFNRTALHRRAAEYYTSIRRPPEAWHGIGDIEPQLSEFDQRIKAGDFDGAARVIDETDYSWTNHHKFLARMLLWGCGRRSVEMRERLDGRLSPDLEVRNLAAAGWVSRRIGDSEKALALLKKGAQIAETGGDAVGRMFVRAELGFLYNDRFADYEGSLRYLRLVREEAARLGETYWEGVALLGLSYAEFDFGNDNSALDYARRALAAFQQQNKPLRVLDTLVRLGMIHRKLRQHGEAFADADAGLKAAREAGSSYWEAEVYSAYGFHHRSAGTCREALGFHDKALGLYRKDAFALREECVQHSYRANLLLDMGAFDEAIGAYRSALAIARDIGTTHEESWILAGLGTAMRRLGAYASAEKLQSQALDIVTRTRNDRSRVIRLTDLAETASAAGKHEAALACLQEALELAARILRKPASAAVPQAFLEAPYLADALPHEMQAPGDHQRRGLILARAYLHLGDTGSALKVIAAARKPEFEAPGRVHYAALLHGVIAHRSGLPDDAGRHYDCAIREAGAALARCPGLYSADLTAAIALAGKSLLADKRGRQQATQRAKSAFRAIRECRYAGVFDDAASLLRELPGAPHAFVSMVAARRPAPPKEEECAAMAAAGA